MFTVGFVFGVLGIEAASVGTGLAIGLVGLVVTEARKQRVQLETHYYLLLGEITAGGARLPNFVTDEDRKVVSGAAERAAYDFFVNWTPDELSQGGPFMWSYRELAIYLMAWRANMEAFVAAKRKTHPDVAEMVQQLIDVVGKLLDAGVEGNEEMAADMIEAVQSARKRAHEMGLATEKTAEKTEA